MPPRSTRESRSPGGPLPVGRGAIALLWGFAESTLFFVVPDVAVAWIALRNGLRAALLAAVLAATGAALGGGIVHAWSTADPHGAATLIERVPAIPAGAVDRAAAALRREGLSAALAGSFQGAPFKVWSAAAPQAGWSLVAWMLAAFPVRLPRFLLVAACFALIGRASGGRIRPAAQTRLFAAGWTAFYILFWMLSPR